MALIRDAFGRAVKSQRFKDMRLKKLFVMPFQW